MKSTSLLLLALANSDVTARMSNGKRPVFHPIPDKPTDEEVIAQNMVQKAHATHTVGSPRVEAPTSARYQCIFQDDQNEWCIQSFSPVLKTGWQWQHQSLVNAYQVEIQPYFTTQFQLDSKMIVDRLFVHEISYSLNSFMVNFVLSSLFGTTGQVCFGFGWESQAIIAKLQTNFQLEECYKTMIADVCNWDDTFYEEKAKWIDECKPSTTSNTITLKDWTFATAMNDFILLGGQAIDGDGCIRFASWSSWAPYIAQSVGDGVKEYITAYLGEPEYDTDEQFRSMEEVLAEQQKKDKVTRDNWNW